MMMNEQQLQQNHLTFSFQSLPKYRRKLRKDQQQAYEGAKMFYYCSIPTSIVGLLFFIAYLFELYIRNHDSSNQTIQQQMFSQTFSLLFSAFVYLVLTVFTYILAVKFYKICNKIEVYPSKRRRSEIQTVQKLISSQTTLNHKNQGFKSNTSVDNGQDTTELKKGSQIQNFNFSLKPSRHFCQSCHQISEYRTKHCKKCNTCVQRYDHHCFWIGNCVGRHNHKYFYLFLLMQCLNNLIQLKVFLMLRSFIMQFKGGIEFHFLIWVVFYSGILMCIGFFIFTGYLLLYHTMLICLGITTWEQMRRDHINYLKYLPTGLNPFSIGLKNNVVKFFTEKGRYDSQECFLEEWEDYLPTFQQAKTIKPGFNCIDNQYYSCC